MNHACRILAILAAPALAAAQTAADMEKILERLSRLEQQNRALLEEVRALRAEIGRGAPPPAETPAAPVAERLAVVERRTEELAQTKVEASSKLPVSLTGMLLFNAFWNTRGGVDQQNPTTAPLAPGGNAGATLRQSIVGLRFNGPDVFAGGKVSGTVFLDLFSGSAASLNHIVRLRTGSLQIDWKNTTFMAGQDKPLISPREPDSLAQVGVSPLTAAGNPWLWQPQARIEQRFGLGDASGLRAQFALFQTSEANATSNPEYTSQVASARPGYEGRFEYWHKFGEDRRLQVAPGFHVSDTHVLGQSVPSRIFSVDWLFRPVAKLEFTGLFFQGENVAVMGSLRQGIAFRNERAYTVRTAGGWMQLTFHATRRLAFHAYGGEQDDRNRDLFRGAVGLNRAYALNATYRLGSNVLAGAEASRVRTNYIGTGNRAVNHYDLALAYLF
jgi:hypothetical protein